MQMFNHDQIEFEVEKFIIPEIPEDLGVGLRRSDTGKVLSIVSKDYTPVQYKDIVTGIEESLLLASQNESISLDLSDTKFDIEVINEGAQLELKARFEGQQTYLDGGAGWLGKGQTELVVPEFVFRTSHNRTWANNGMMGVWRSKCWNVYNAATYWSSHPSLMTGKNGGTFYSGYSTSGVKENKPKVKLREDRVAKMLISPAWKELEMAA